MEALMQFLQRPRVIVVFILLASTGLALRMFGFISRYTVNILYWELWGYYAPLFQHWGPWQLFTSWNTMQRGGLGMLAAALLANLTGWNSRADAFAVGAFLCGVVALALVLKWLLFRSFTFYDVAIPLLSFTLFQYETWVIMPVLWAGALPVLLIVLYCLALLVRAAALRCVLVVLLNFLLVYTGNGMFMGAVTVILLAAELWQSRSQRAPVLIQALALAAVLLTNASWFIAFNFRPYVPGFGFSVANLAGYPVFVGLMLAAFWGWHVRILGLLIPAVAGSLLLLASIAILVDRVRRLHRQGIRGDHLSLVIAVLIGFSLIFCLATAVGRISLGLQQAQVSRYVPLMIPVYVGWYLHLSSLKAVKARRIALAGFLAVALAGSLPLGIIEAQALRIYENKLDWKRCYLQYEVIQKCDELTHFKIYPGVDDLPDKLEYLKTHHLNLYRDGGN